MAGPGDTIDRGAPARRPPRDGAPRRRRHGEGRRIKGLRIVDAGADRALDDAVDAVEAAFAAGGELLLQSLGEVDLALDCAPPGEVRGMREQVSFVRVAVRCIADAIGELAAESTQPVGVGEPAGFAVIVGDRHEAPIDPDRAS